MSIRLQMAGTGNAFAKSFFNNNAFIQSDSYHLMIDFGQTAPLALHHMNVPLDQVHGVLITHLHADHTNGLEELAFQSLYRYGHANGKIQLFIADSLVDQLWENTLKAGLLNEKDGYSALEHYFDVRPLKAKERYAITDHLSVELIQTEHVPGKLSYSVFINNHIFYSSDMVFNRQLLEHVVYERGCAYIFHDCQLEGEGRVHATLSELLTLPEDLQSRIYLMHYSDTMPSYIGKTGLMTFIEQHRTYEL